MNPNRRLWNQRQQELRRNLVRGDNHQKAMALFLSQHAMVHAGKMSDAGLWSFEDEILERLTDSQIRSIPRNFDHSIAWVLWHLARIEDVTMNLLIAGSPQILFCEDWLGKIQISIKDTGNGMTPEGILGLSAAINLEGLRGYRLSVGRKTRKIAQLLQPEQLKMKVDQTRLRQLSLEGAVLENSHDVISYWSGLTVAGLLLMPPTRHNFVHLNEALRIKQKLG